MRGVVSAVRPLADATTAGERVFGMKQQRAAVPAPRRAGAFSVPRSTSVDVKKRVPVHDATAGDRASRKRQPAGPREFLDPKRVKLTLGAAADVETVVFAAAVKTPVSTGQDRLKKRLAVELDALRDLVKKAAALSRGPRNRRFLAAEPRQAKRIKKSPLVERIDVPRMSRPESKIKSGVVLSPIAIRAASPRVPVEKASQACSIQRLTSRDKTPSAMSPEEGEIITFTLREEDEECIDICGGVSPVAIRVATPLEEVAAEACSPTSDSSDSESSSSSDSDSGSDSDDSSSDSDSDTDEIADSAAPAAVPPKENNRPAPQGFTSAPPASEAEQSAEPERNSDESVSSPVLSEKIDSPVQPPARAPVMVQSAEPVEKVSVSVLLARAKEVREIREQKGNGWEREKTRRAVRAMEKAVLPDERIHPRDLAKVGIAEFQYVLGKLGICLRTDV